MNQNLILIIVGAAALVLLIFGRRGFIVPNTPLNWDTLTTLMRDESTVEKIDITDLKSFPAAEVQMQFLSGRDSVKYHRTTKDGVRAETLDVLRPGSAGFIVTFHGDVVTRFTRIGGRDSHNPHFNPSATEVLQGLLRRIRGYADT